MSVFADYFNVFEAQYELLQSDYFAGSAAEGRVLFESEDRRHLVVATRYPQGVEFRYGGRVDYQEAFYIVKGSGSRVFQDGTSIAIREGDLIYVRPAVEIDYVYHPGLIDVAFFWSDSGPLDPALAQGVRHRGVKR